MMPARSSDVSSPNSSARVSERSTDGVGTISNGGRWAIVGLLFTASLINYFDRATISFALPLISKELHLGPEAKGVLLSAFFWSYALMQIPMGVLADRVNLRWLYAGGVHAVVDLAGPDGTGDRPRHADRVPDAARRRRSDLSARRLEDREPAVSRRPSADCRAACSMPARARDW